jgi:two-component system OmpR family response regulator
MAFGLYRRGLVRILLLEDDAKLTAFTVKGLKEAGHLVHQVANGHEALLSAIKEPFDLLIADRMVPGLDGLSTIKAIRAAGIKLPIIILTAIGGVDDRVEGLEAGADDYLVKPFAFSELLARINALSRRPPLQTEKVVLKVADVELDLVRRRVTRQGRLIELQPREFTLLEILMRNEGRVVTRTMLLEQVWDLHFDPQTSVVETHISRLRSKIDKSFDSPLLHTVRNVGYSLHVPE